MAADRRLILVTGAPRTATTPVGNMLATAPRTVTLYEPLGPTGLKRIENRFPMVGEGLDLDEKGLRTILQDLATFRTRGLRSQAREGGGMTLRTALLGSRTLHTYRLAWVQPWAKTVIWKDPHAIMLAPDVAATGIPTVVTLRAPLAQAASYKRLGWKSRALEIYPRWSQRFGRCEVCEGAFSEIDNPVISSALLWRQCYLALIRSGTLDSIHLISSDQLVTDEQGTYETLFRTLGLEGGNRVGGILAKRRNDGAAVPTRKTTHDWTRSVASVNSYWKNVLEAREIDRVEELTRDVVDQLNISNNIRGGSGNLSRGDKW